MFPKSIDLTENPSTISPSISSVIGCSSIFCIKATSPLPIKSLPNENKNREYKYNSIHNFALDLLQSYVAYPVLWIESGLNKGFFKALKINCLCDGLWLLS